MGGLVVFFLEDWDNVHEFKHNSGIKDIVAEPNGTKVSLEIVNIFTLIGLNFLVAQQIS
jgi:hypothetical protein